MKRYVGIYKHTAAYAYSSVYIDTVNNLYIFVYIHYINIYMYVYMYEYSLMYLLGFSWTNNQGCILLYVDVG